MASSTTSRSSHKHFVFSILLLSFPLLFLAVNFRASVRLVSTSSGSETEHGRRWETRDSAAQLPQWFRLIENETRGRKIRVGLVNIDSSSESDPESGNGLEGRAEIIDVNFDRVSGSLVWDDFFPKWIDEDTKFSPPTCPEIPMPGSGNYRDLNVVVARVPCGNATSKRAPRDLFRLQVNLVVANLLVADEREKHDEADRTVYAVFIGTCEPMVEIFRCDDLVKKFGDHRVYKPDRRRLRQKVRMPVGPCQLAPPYAMNGDGTCRSTLQPSLTPGSYGASDHRRSRQAREAYVTVLHSTEAYVCGAIVLAHSIKRTNTTRDLVLLADSSITNKSLIGLRAAGWKVKHIDRIRSPRAEEGAYNEWNYSKLRVWQLTQYDKVVFVDADLLVLQNIDDLFVFPELSAAGNDRFLFNSGIMVLEPSSCVFEQLMQKRFELESYNGGDQGFLNEFFPWWHRLPRTINFLKIFDRDKERSIPGNVRVIHYLGLKPWTCYRDYDCNWDMEDPFASFASDSANERWWEVYDSVPPELKGYCALTEDMDFEIRKWRRIARNSNLRNGHWQIKVRDPRRLRDED